MPGVTPAEVLSNFGITLVEDPAENQPRLLVDLPAAELVEHAIRREEGHMASNGALVIETGERTCLTLDMAYNNARLICRPETSWIKR